MDNMITTELVVRDKELKIKRRDNLATGQVGNKIQLIFETSKWSIENTNIDVIFKVDETQYSSAVLSDNTVIIPWETCQNSNLGKILYIGVRLSKKNVEDPTKYDLVYPTIYCRLGVIEKGTNTDNIQISTVPTITSYDKAYLAAVDAKNSAIAAKTAAEEAQEAAEDASERAEASLDKLPKIGTNGNWYIWDNTKTPPDYKDSGIKAIIRIDGSYSSIEDMYNAKSSIKLYSLLLINENVDEEENGRIYIRTEDKNESGNDLYIISTNAANTPIGVQWTRGNEVIIGTLEASAADKTKAYFVPNRTDDYADYFGFRKYEVSEVSGTYSWILNTNQDNLPGFSFEGDLSGVTGNGIAEITGPHTTTQPLKDKYTIIYTEKDSSGESKTQDYFVTNGRGITSISETSRTERNLNATYTITYNDNTLSTYIVKDGKSAYQLAQDYGYEGTEEEWNNAVNTARIAAETAQTNAELAQTAAETAKTNAETAKVGAETAKTSAQAAYNGAESARNLAQAWAEELDSAESKLLPSGSSSAKQYSINTSAAESRVALTEGRINSAETRINSAETRVDTSEANALLYRQISEQYAKGTKDGTAVTESELGYHDNSKYYKELSNTYSNDALTSRKLSERYANGKEFGTPVTTGEGFNDNAMYYRDKAAEQVTAAKSWAVGGTSSRTGEATDNSKYYSEQSAASWNKLQNMTVNATTLEPGSEATVTKTELESIVNLEFGIPTGDTGPAAGFGTVDASINATVGTPEITVTSDGPDTAKNFYFAFKNLKGNTGNGIKKIEKTAGTGAAGTSDTYTITYTNDSTFVYQVYNGADGLGAGDMMQHDYDRVMDGTIETHPVVTAGGIPQYVASLEYTEQNLIDDWNNIWSH